MEPSSARAIELWLQGAPERRARLEEMRAVFHGTEPRRVSWDTEALWKRLSDKVAPAPRPTVIRPGRRFSLRVKESRWRNYALIAASVLATLGIGWALARVTAHGVPDQKVAVAPVERRTAAGERVSFRLADGTGVMLGPASRLRYHTNYGQNGRTVELEGVGYFEVVHDEARPFVVRSGSALIQDLGTRFAIRARPREGRIEVAVAQGKVTVGRVTATQRVLLAPGDVARLPDSGAVAVRRGVNVDRYFAWTEGRLVFDRAPLGAVVAELGRWYDVEIRLADSGLARRLLTAAYRNKPVVEVLALIAASLDLTLSGHGRTFTLADR